MKRIFNTNILFLLFTISLFSACQKKKIDMQIIETACKNFKIEGPSVKWVVDPSCGASNTTATLKVSFKYTGEKKCLKKIVFAPRFFYSDNTEFTNVGYNPFYPADDPKVTINGDSISVLFDFTFNTIQEASDLNHVYLKFHVRNEIDNETNKLEVRANGACSTVDPKSYKVVQTKTVTTPKVSVTFWDDGAEDGDIISVYLNGVWVLDNYTLKKDGETFTFNLQQGDNNLVLFAVNEGSVGPNTAAMSVNNGTKFSISPDLLTGEAVDIKLQ